MWPRPRSSHPWCWLRRRTPARPQWLHRHAAQAGVHDYLTSDGRKKIEYKVDITCDAGRTANVTQQRWEHDNLSTDDLQGTTGYNVHFLSRTTVTKSAIQALPTDGIGEGYDYAEVYQPVSFHVTSDDTPPVISADTRWESSPVVSIRE